jgi:hypothetical protein
VVRPPSAGYMGWSSTLAGAAGVVAAVGVLGAMWRSVLEGVRVRTMLDLFGPNKSTGIHMNYEQVCARVDDLFLL